MMRKAICFSFSRSPESAASLEVVNYAPLFSTALRAACASGESVLKSAAMAVSAAVSAGFVSGAVSGELVHALVHAAGSSLRKLFDCRLF